MEIVRYEIGDVVRLKKNHPCGAATWIIYRTGLDFGLKCRGCGHRVMIPRPQFEKAVRRRWVLGEDAPPETIDQQNKSARTKRKR